MKFKIRFADQIVGIFTFIAMLAVVGMIFAVGANNNWFVQKLNYYTIFESGSGISVGTALTYKGFAIGKVTKVSLEKMWVRADYYILAEYESYIKEGSLVQLITSPIGLGSEFVFHPGRGEELMPDGAEIYRVGSRHADEIIEKRLNFIRDQSDSIGVLLNKASTLLDNVNNVLKLLTDAIQDRGRGTNKIKDLVAEIINIIKDSDVLVQDADNLVLTTSPELESITVQLQSSMVQIQDVLTGLKNNPLIKGGIPDRTQEKPVTSNQRNLEF